MKKNTAKNAKDFKKYKSLKYQKSEPECPEGAELFDILIVEIAQNCTRSSFHFSLMSFRCYELRKVRETRQGWRCLNPSTHLCCGAGRGGSPGAHSPETAGKWVWSRCPGCWDSGCFAGWTCGQRRATPSPGAPENLRVCDRTDHLAAAPETPPEGRKTGKQRFICTKMKH